MQVLHRHAQRRQCTLQPPVPALELREWHGWSLIDSLIVSQVRLASTLYQTKGLSLKMTGQGSHTPTQLEWRQVGKVWGVQSSTSTDSSFPVPCVRTRPLGIETRYLHFCCQPLQHLLQPKGSTPQDAGEAVACPLEIWSARMRR